MAAAGARAPGTIYSSTLYLPKMTNLVSFYICLVFLHVWNISSHETSPESSERSENNLKSGEFESQEDRKISVLLINGLYLGHLFPLVSLGEELVRRGHNVTLCANVLKGSSIYPEIAERVGIQFLNPGYDSGFTQEEFDDFQLGLYSLKADRFAVKNMHMNEPSMIQIRAKVEETGLDKFDMIISDAVLMPIGIYFHKKGKKSVLFSTLLGGRFPATEPEWPVPIVNSGQADDLSFIERFLNTLFIRLFFLTLFNIFLSIPGSDPYYKEVLGNVTVLSYPGVHIPMIITSVYGFDYPRIRWPLIEYVGPVLTNSPPQIDGELQTWLDGKPRKSVICISMGTTASLSENNARAILEAVMSTPYHALWVIKPQNRDVLNGVDLTVYGSRLFLAEWVPQQRVLRHVSILMTVLHCGLNGVQESLSNALPVICIPYAYDQFEVATRIASAGVGIPMYGFIDSLRGKKEFDSDAMKGAIHSLLSGNYAENALKIQRLFKQAGGVKRAADLIEFYEDVGYEHLVPAYAKHEWNWVQLYNADVWITLCMTCFGVGWVWWKIAKWVLHRCGCC